MRPSGFPRDLRSLIADSLKGLDLETGVKEQTCLLVWDEVVGEQVASSAQPEFVKDGRMFVVTKSPVWANELSFYKADMIARLNRRVGADALKDIIFKVGRLPERRNEPVAEDSGVDMEGIQLTDRELEKMEATAGEAGAEAAKSMRSLLETALRLEKWKLARGWSPCKRCGVLQNTASGVCPPCRMELQE